MSLTMSNISRYGSHYLIKGLAASFFHVFIPVYLYANGFSLAQVGFFYFAQEVFNLIFSYILYRKVYQWGVRNVLLTAAAAQVIMLLLVYNLLTIQVWFLFVLALIRGFHDSFYWGSDDIIMVHLSGKNVGAFLARWNGIIMTLGVIILPISGYVLDHYSPFWLIVMAIALLVISVLPLLNLKLDKLPNNKRRKFIRDFIRTGEGKYIVVANHITEILTKIVDTILPLFIFIAFSNFISVSFAEVLTILIGAGYVYLVGDWSEDKPWRQRILSFNIIAFLLVLILLIIIKVPLFIFVAVSLLTISRLGACLSVTVGINQICLRQDCYAIKMFARMAMNLGGMLLGVSIMLADWFSFSGAFTFLVGYIFIGALLIYRRRRFI